MSSQSTKIQIRMPLPDGRECFSNVGAVLPLRSTSARPLATSAQRALHTLMPHGVSCLRYRVP